MGLMHRFMYKFSSFAAILATVLALTQGASLETAVFRGGVVFLVTLLFFILALYVLRWVIVATTVVEALEGDDEQPEAEKKKASPAPEREKLNKGQVVTEGMLLKGGNG